MKTSKIIFFLLLGGIILFPATNLNAQSSGKSAALETMGMQGGAVLYNTYSLIGSINDGYISNAWSKETSISLLDEQIKMMGTISDQYQKLLDSGFLTDPDDSLTMAKMKKGVNLLRTEASALEENINNPSDENRAAYDKARDEAWALITDVLDLKSDK